MCFGCVGCFGCCGCGGCGGGGGCGSDVRLDACVCPYAQGKTAQRGAMSLWT